MRFAPYLLVLISVVAPTVLPLKRHLYRVPTGESGSSAETQERSASPQGKGSWLDQYRGLLDHWMSRTPSDRDKEEAGDIGQQHQEPSSISRNPEVSRNPSAFERRVGAEGDAGGRIGHPHFFGPKQIEEEEKMPQKQHQTRKTPTKSYDSANVASRRQEEETAPEKNDGENKSFLSSLLGSFLPVFDVGSGGAGGSPHSYAKVSKSPLRQQQQRTQTLFANHEGMSAENNPRRNLQQDEIGITEVLPVERQPGNLASVRSGYAQVNRQNQNPRHELKLMPQPVDMQHSGRISQSDNEILNGGDADASTVTSGLRSSSSSPKLDVAAFCKDAMRIIHHETGEVKDRLWALVRHHNMPIAKEDAESTSDRQIVLFMASVCNTSISDLPPPETTTNFGTHLESTPDHEFIKATNPRKRSEENDERGPVESASGPFLSARFDENGFDDEEDVEEDIITAKPDNVQVQQPHSLPDKGDDAIVVSGGFTFAPAKKSRVEAEDFSMKPGVVVDGDLDGLDKRQGRPPFYGHAPPRPPPPPPRNDRRPQQSDSFYANRVPQTGYFPLNDRGGNRQQQARPPPPPTPNFQNSISQPRNDFPQQRPNSVRDSNQAHRKQAEQPATTLHQLAAQSLPSHVPASVNREVRRTIGPAESKPVISTTVIPIRQYTNFDRLDAVSIAVDTLHHGSTGTAPPLPIDLPEVPLPSSAPRRPTNDSDKTAKNVTHDDVHYVYNVTFLSSEQATPRSEIDNYDVDNNSTLISKDDEASSSEYYPYEDDKSNEILVTTTREAMRTQTEVAPLSVLPDVNRLHSSIPAEDSSVVSSNYYPVVASDEEERDAEVAVRNSKPLFSPTTRSSSHVRGGGSRSGSSQHNQFTEFHAPPDVEMSYGTKTPVFDVVAKQDSKDKILTETGGFSTFQKSQTVPKARVPLKEEEISRRPTTTAASTLATTTMIIAAVLPNATTTVKSDEYYYVYEDYDTADDETTVAGRVASNTTEGKVQEPDQANDEKNNSHADEVGEQQGATRFANESGINDRNNNDHSFVNVESTTSISLTTIKDNSPSSQLPVFPNNYVDDITTEAEKPDKELQAFIEHGFNYKEEIEEDEQADNTRNGYVKNKNEKESLSDEGNINKTKDSAADLASNRVFADHESPIKVKERTQETLVGKLEEEIRIDNNITEQIFKSSMRNDRFAEDGLRSSDLAIEPSPVRESSDLEENLNPEKLAYILIGVCCGLSILCLIVVAVSIGYKSETHYRLDDGRRKRHIRLLKASNSEETSSSSSNSGSGSTSQYSETDESDRNSEDMAGMKLGPWFNGKHNIQTLDRKSNMVFPTSVYLTNLEGQEKGLKLSSSDDDDILGASAVATAATAMADNASLSSFDTIRTDPNLLQDPVVPHQHSRIRVLPDTVHSLRGDTKSRSYKKNSSYSISATRFSQGTLNLNKTGKNSNSKDKRKRNKTQGSVTGSFKYLVNDDTLESDGSSGKGIVNTLASSGAENSKECNEIQWSTNVDRLI